MKLLLDENLSPRLVQALSDEFPGIAHVELFRLRGSTDRAIWEFARANDYILVSKDNDFRQLSFLFGPPPKVIWLSVGNAGTEAIGRVLRNHRDRITTFVARPDEGLLIIDLPSPAEAGFAKAGAKPRGGN